MAKKNEVTEQIEIIPIDKIDYPVSNHRQSMDEAKLQELSNSIASVGVQQPVKVCRRDGRYAMIFGHRRVQACQLAELTDVPAIVVDGWSDEQIAEAQVIENILREDLNPIEEAKCVQTLVEGSMFPLDVAASKMGKSLAWARQRLELLRLHESLLEFVASGRLPLGHAVLISRVGDQEDQVELARSAMGVSWSGDLADARKSDHVNPLREVRKEIKWKLCKMGSARWPKDVEYAGRRACIGCPDNTETDPGLFDSLQIERTSAKGNCTNAECFRAKGEAWEKDPVKIERDKARDAKKKAKAKNDDDTPRAGSKANESYAEREKRIKKLKKQFPWNTEQRFALAMFEYGESLVLAIGRYIAGIEYISSDPIRDILLFAFCGDSFSLRNISQNFKMLDIASGKTSIGSDVLSEIWNELAGLDSYRKPKIDYDGDVDNVPLPDDLMEEIESLEKIAEVLGVAEVPVRPTTEAIEQDALVAQIAKANKADALKAIADCKDALLLETIAFNAEKLKLAKYKLKAIGERITELSQPPIEESAAGNVCEICGEESDIEQEVCSVCYELILHGPKKKKDEVIAAIEKAPLGLLEEIQNENPRGDWRRAAVAKAIANLKAGE